MARAFVIPIGIALMLRPAFLLFQAL